MRHRFAFTIALALVAAAPLGAAKPPDTWDGLHRVKAKHLDSVYLLPNADFRGYTKVMLDPTEVAFRKNWQRDQNQSEVDLTRRVTDQQARKILTEAQAGFDKLFAKAYQDAGYQVVTEAGPDVLRVESAIINLDVEAPDTMSPGISRTYSREAGAATLVVQAKDSLSGTILGRAVDGRSTGEGPIYVRNTVTNAAEFEQVFSQWAKISAEGLTELKALSPINANGQQIAKR